MKILDKEIENIDLQDVDFVEKLQKELVKTQEAINKLENKDIVALKEYCNIVRNFFIDIFGNDDMLPKNNNFQLITQAYLDFNSEFQRINKEFIDNLNTEAERLKSNYSLDRLNK